MNPHFVLHSLFSLLWFWLPILGVMLVFWDMILEELGVGGE